MTNQQVVGACEGVPTIEKDGALAYLSGVMVTHLLKAIRLMVCFG